MRKRLLVFITLFLVTGLVAGWYFFAKESRYLGSSPIKAVPSGAPFFVRVRNLGEFAGKSVKNSCWKTVRNFSPISGLFDDLVLVDSLMRHNEEYGNALKNRELYIVPTDSSTLFLLGIESIADKNIVNTLVRNYLISRKGVVTIEKYKNVSLQHYTLDTKSHMSVAYFKGILMFGGERASLKMSIDQLEQSSAPENSDYLRINKNATENADLNIFVNHRSLSSFLSKYFTDSLACGILMPNYAKWTEVDLLQKENQLFVNGYTVGDSTLFSYVDVFKRQKPLASTILHEMPESTTYFATQRLSQISQYFEDFDHYLKKNNTYQLYNREVAAVSSLLKLDVKQYIISHWTGEAAVVFTNHNLEDKSDNRFFLMKINSQGADPLVSAIKKWSAGAKNREQESDFPDPERNNIWRVPTSKFGNFFGDFGLGSPPTNWMTVGEGFVLMGASPESLLRYLELLKNGKTLDKVENYIRFSSGLARTSNFYMWCSPRLLLPFLEPLIRPAYFQTWSSDPGSLAKIENIAWQWGCENGMVYNTASLVVNPAAQQIRLPFWRYKLRAGMRGKPQFVSFASSNSKNELIFQDLENNLTDLTNQGTERWRVHLEGAILGIIKTIDVNKSGEFQLLFNTSEAIHLIDRKGKEIKGFPVRLKSQATNELALFDYDGNREYRFVIACSDHKVYNLDKHGKPIPGWQPKPTSENVLMPVRHFRDGKKDYIVYVDGLHTYVVDRQGKERLSVKADYVRSRNGISQVTAKGGRNWMVSTDEHGKIRLLGFDGSIKNIATGNFSSGHYFLPVDFNGDGEVRFIFAEKKKILCYDLSGHLIFSHVLDFTTDRFPSILTLGKEILVELYSEAENRTLLVRQDGSIFDNFLPERCTFPVQGTFEGQTGVVNRVGCTSDGFLSNYQMIVK